MTATNATGADTTPATVSITVAPARPDLANASAASLVAGPRSQYHLVHQQRRRCADQLRGGQDAAHWPRPGPHQRQRQLRNHRHPASRQQSDHLHSDCHQRHGRGLHAGHCLHHCRTGAAQPCQCQLPPTSLQERKSPPSTLSNSGGGMLTNCAVDKTLPTGLDLDRTSDNGSCEITGTPDAATAEATYTITATNATGADSTPATVSITVAPGAARPCQCPCRQPHSRNGNHRHLVHQQWRRYPDQLRGGQDAAHWSRPGPHQRQWQLRNHRHPGRCQLSEATYTITATNATGADATPATVSITVAPARPDLANAPAASLTAGTRASTILFTNNGGALNGGCTADSLLRNHRHPGRQRRLHRLATPATRRTWA